MDNKLRHDARVTVLNPHRRPSAIRNLLPGILTLLLTVSVPAEVQMQTNIAHGGWPHCLRLSNGQIELLITTDVGPRVLRCGFVGGQNFFHEVKAEAGLTGGDTWRPYGGHRLWHAPEADPRTYAPDNAPVAYTWDGRTLKLTQPKEPTTGIAKAIEITIDPNANHVRLVHRLINQNLWDVELAPWCLTFMAQGGRAIVPQEPYRPHPDYLLPARPLVLWHYTDLSDPRYIWTPKYIQMKQDPQATTKQKIGLLNKQGWAGYALNGEFFLKRFAYDPQAAYADYGCNNELFTNSDMLELETLGPLTKLASQCGQIEQVEDWYLFRLEVGDTDNAIDAALLPVVRATAPK